MNHIALDITDYIIVYGTYLVLFILIYLFAVNFVSHFKFNYKCPWILKDEEVNGIYPTLLTVHILISLLVSSVVVGITHNDEHNMAHSTFTFTSCYIRFTIFSTNVLAPNFMHNGYYLLILTTLSSLLLLETYLSYSRYYGCAVVVEQFRIPSRWQVFKPYIVYIVILLILIWCTISMIPIIMLFLCALHFIINTYFSYFFYVSVKISYHHVFKLHKNMRFIGDAYQQMQNQIKQIRFVFYLATISALTSSFVNFSFTLCYAVRLVPFGLCANSLCLCLMLTKNRLLLTATARCKCNTVHELMCVAPWSIINKRKASAFPHPSTLQKIKTASAKALREIPRQMTPVLHRIRTSSNAINKTKKIAPPPNTPRFSTPQNSNLDIIDEVNPNKFALDDDDLTNTSSQKRNSATQSSEEITTNSAKHSSRSRHLKPYSLTTSSLVSKHTSSTPTISMDFALNMNQLDTIPAEDEIITFAAADIPHFEPMETDKSDLEQRASPKRYRSRRHHSNISIPDENEIVQGFGILSTYHEDEFDFGRMKNIRATMHEEHIEEIKIELADLASIEIDGVMKEECDADDGDDDDVNQDKKEEEEDQRASLKKKVEQIQLTKEELEQEKKLIQLKKKTNKRIAFGADIALEILQESIAAQEEKRKEAQHEFYINAIMKNNRSVTAHQMTPVANTDEHNAELKAPRVTPSHSPIGGRSVDDMDHDINLTDDDLDEIPNSANPTQCPSHLRSRSDNQMIVDIANQIALHAKQLSLKKTGSERARKVNPKMKQQPNKKTKIHPRPKLNLQSVSEGTETTRKNMSISGKHGNYLSPNDATPSFKPRKHRNYSSDDLDSFDINAADEAMEASPSPPPEAYLDAMRPYKQDKSSTTHDLSSGHSIFDTFRSWLTPSIHISTERRSTKTDSDRANNLEKFLKTQGFTMRSERRFSDLITQITDHERATNVDKPYTIQEGDEEEEETTTGDKCEVVMGHVVFNINTDIKYTEDSNDDKLFGHKIMTIDPSASGYEHGHDRNISTAL